MRAIAPALLAATLLFAGVAQAQNQTTTGPCSPAVGNVGHDVTINLYCVPGEPALSIEVKYLHLDPIIYSYLIAGTAIEGLDEVIGADPIIIDNPTNLAFRKMLDPKRGFGTMADRSSILGSRIFLSDDSHPPEMLSQFVLRKKVTVLDHFNGFVYPDVDAARSLAVGSGWPAGYAFEPLSWFEPGSNAIAPPTLWKVLGNADLDDYPGKLKRFALSAAPQGLIARVQDWQTSPLYSRKSLRGRIKVPTEAERTMNFLTWISAGPWPKGLVQAQIDGEENIWKISVTPPAVRIVVLAIHLLGPNDSAHLAVGAYHVTRSRFSALRNVNSNPDGAGADVPFATGSLTAKRWVLIPMQIEIQRGAPDWTADLDLSGPDPSDRAEPDAGDAALAMDRLRKNTVAGKVTISIVGHKYVKDAAPLAAPAVARPNPKFIYGPSEHDVVLKVRGKPDMKLRAPYRNIVMLDHGYITSQCPLLYVQRRGSSDVIKIGRVLVGAAGRAALRQETIELGPDLASVILAEDEPELTMLQSMEILGRPRGSHDYVVVARRGAAMLNYGDRLQLAAGGRFDDFKLRLAGYYERLDRPALRAAAR